MIPIMQNLEILNKKNIPSVEKLLDINTENSVKL